MGQADEASLRSELASLREEHRDLDSAINAIEETRPFERLQIQRLKKRKLFIKDRISHLEDQLTPDIIA
ncbi:YdcH family protein [Tepidamorphus sp. 3E244]|uniref:YdcH family protein n=1 Tax=Tepidamorphus sp. 3E244 TaxID=3385498 RepID=UPI0038FCE900